MKERYWKYWVIVVVLVGSLFIIGCTQQTTPPTSTPTSPDEASAWMDIPLTDVTTGEEFRISDFKGKPVLLESFAVWCPTCLRQQKQMEELQARKGEAIVHISLDTDPNEDVALVKEHMERNGLNWYFVVSPTELTNALIDEFGLAVVSAPSAPVVLVCADQSARLLKSGVKSADTLLAEIEMGCE